MIKVIVGVLLTMVLCGSAHAEEDYMKWTAADIGMQIAATGLAVVDWGQTIDGTRLHTSSKPAFTDEQGRLWFSSRIRTYNEINPILGKHPHKDKVHVYFATSVIAEVVASHYIPKVMKCLGASDATAKYSRTVFQAFTIGFEGGVTLRNANIGVKVKF